MLPAALRGVARQIVVLLAVFVVAISTQPIRAEEPHAGFLVLEERIQKQADLLQEQQQAIRQQQDELQSLRAIIDQPAAPVAVRVERSPLTSGYDKGFFIRRPPDPSQPDAEPFLMKINSRMQFRHTLLDSDGPGPDENDFEFERLRLVFSGHVWIKDLTYFFQFDADSDQTETVDMLDYYFAYDLGESLGIDRGAAAIRVGKWKMPFNRARAEPGFKLQLVDRSLASVFFDINRSPGVGLFLKNDFAGRPVQTQLALHNGFKTGGFRPVRTAQLDRNFAVSGRLISDVVGEWGKDGEYDLTPHDCPAIRVGAGFAWTQIDNEGLREFQRQRVVDSGATLASLLPAGVSEYDVAF
jgi:hypothetical protein